MRYGKQVIQIGFQGDGFDIPDLSSVSSGFAELDNTLAGGWRNGVVMDILLDEADVAELKVLLPTLAQLSRQQERWVLWVAPPEIPDDQVLELAGLDISRVLVVRTETISNRLATIERALSYGECSAVVAWPGAISESELNRLQIAAHKGRSYCYLMRDSESAITKASAVLRLKLTADGDGTGSELMRRQGGWPQPRFVVDTNCIGSRAAEPNMADIIPGPWAQGRG